jgi:integrase
MAHILHISLFFVYLTKNDKIQEGNVRQYYLRQRSTGGKWYVIIMNTITKKQVLSRCSGTYDKNQADSIAQDWLVNGPPDSNKVSKNISKLRNMVFCDYIYNFWDYEKSDYIKEKIKEGKQQKKSHPLEMQGIINRYYRPYFKQSFLCEITEESLTEFLVYLRTEINHIKKTKKEIKSGLSASTVKLARNAAIVPLRYAKRKRIIKTFDFDIVIKPNGDFEERGILNRDQVDALFKLQWRDKRAFLICKIASQAAARIGEIRALRVCDIFEDRINIQHSWSDDDGGLKCTKNRTTRTIPILPDLYQEIVNYMKQEKLTMNLNNLLFPGKKKEKPYSHKQINKEFYLMLEKLGISETERINSNIVFHSWRHYGAKHLAENTDRNTGMAILGHKTPNLFDRYSNHTDKETFSKMTKAIQDCFGNRNVDNTEPLSFPKLAIVKQNIDLLSGEDLSFVG